MLSAKYPWTLVEGYFLLAWLGSWLRSQCVCALFLEAWSRREAALSVEILNKSPR